MKRLLVVVALAAAAGPAFAADRMYSYDPASPDAKRLTGRGLTFIFEQGLMKSRAKRILATAVSARAELKAIGDGVLGKGGRAAVAGEDFPGQLYEVDPKQAQGRVFIRAWCPGSTRLWMAIGRFDRVTPLSVVALGEDPAAPGQAKVCARMEFSFHGEWKLPGRGAPDPLDDPLLGSGLDAAGQ
jgi:hypothetical protein